MYMDSESATSEYSTTSLTWSHCRVTVPYRDGKGDLRDGPAWEGEGHGYPCAFARV